MLVPPEPVTVTCTLPVPGGATAVICVGELTVKMVAVLPNRTVSGPVNPVPVMMTVLPPEAGPAVGEMAVMVGTTT
nr:hypothetical protein [Nocardia abscessus]